MSDGQGDAAGGIETSSGVDPRKIDLTPKIDQRLIDSELEFRGKVVEVRNSTNTDWKLRKFHTVGGGECWTWGAWGNGVNEFGDKLYAWSFARPIEKRWRTPTDEYVIKYIQKHGKRPACRVRDKESNCWCGGHELVYVAADGIHRFVTQTSWFRYCQIEDEA